MTVFKDMIIFEGLKYSIPEFVRDFPEIAHVKDVATFSYLLSNQNNLDIYGFASEEELIGKTIFDLSKHMQGKWPEGFAEKIHREDQHVANNAKNVFLKPVEVLNNDGYVVISYLMKTPLFGADKKVKAILTLAFNSTRLEDTKSLFFRYLDLYKDSKDLANKKFLEYLNFPLLDQSLTSREIEVLITLSQCKNVKNTSKELHIAPKTLEAHLHNIRLKLGVVDISKILINFTSSVGRKF